MKVDESQELGGARFVMTWPIKPLTQTIVADELTQEKKVTVILMLNKTDLNTCVGNIIHNHY